MKRPWRPTIAGLMSVVAIFAFLFGAIRARRTWGEFREQAEFYETVAADDAHYAEAHDKLSRDLKRIAEEGRRECERLSKEGPKGNMYEANCDFADEIQNDAAAYARGAISMREAAAKARRLARYYRRRFW